ncbi:phage protein, putative [Enterococcus mundtii QU 25]|uniref:DUF1642 domain-containing protein n=1 Tax=Enterococcus mundtii TaxID=53346 RepID=UPI0003C544E5|nr:DUF1642 domain-containing protein [Enterococcus mundtii]BAO06337.1 phage protein, putative [Enterococcus mundtii QU 25]
MNKQELIDKLASLVGSMEDFKGITAFHDGKYAGLEHALELIQQLDEPQKPVVPKFVAEWLEKMRKQLVSYHFESGARFMMFIGIDYHQRRGLLTLNEKVRRWLEKDGNEVKLSNAIDYGYEVEQEPLYYVYFPEITASAGIGEAYLMKTRNGVELADNNDFDDMKFTEQEIKTIDERYWAFAVPVEEVMEG